MVLLCSGSASALDCSSRALRWLLHIWYRSFHAFQNGELTTPAHSYGGFPVGERRCATGLLPRLPIVLRKQEQSAQGKETRYEGTRLDILEAFGVAGPSVSGLIDRLSRLQRCSQ